MSQPALAPQPVSTTGVPRRAQPARNSGSLTSPSPIRAIPPVTGTAAAAADLPCGSEATSLERASSAAAIAEE